MSEPLKELFENHLHSIRYYRKHDLDQLDRHKKDQENIWENIDKIKDRLDKLTEEEAAIYQAAAQLGITVELEERY